MDELDAKLEKARAGAKNYGNLRGLKDTADDYLKGVYAGLYHLAPDGTVPDKEAWVRRQPSYTHAVKEKSNRYADWCAAEIYMKILFAEVDKYRTDQATNRNIDKVHM